MYVLTLGSRAIGPFDDFESAESYRKANVKSLIGAWACHVENPREPKDLPECEFCGSPATIIEQWDSPVPVCEECSAELPEEHDYA